ASPSSCPACRPHRLFPPAGTTVRPAERMQMLRLQTRLRRRTVFVRESACHFSSKTDHAGSEQPPHDESASPPGMNVVHACFSDVGFFISSCCLWTSCLLTCCPWTSCPFSSNPLTSCPFSSSPLTYCPSTSCLSSSCHRQEPERRRARVTPGPQSKSRLDV